MAAKRSNALIIACILALLGMDLVDSAMAQWSLRPFVEAAAPEMLPTTPEQPLDIVKLGAVGDGKTDNSKVINQAWKTACGATGTQKILIPKGNFLVGPLDLEGPCTSSVIIHLDGNLIATGDLNAYEKDWIQVMNVDNFIIDGPGTIDGNGPLVWQKNQCTKNYHCKILPNSLVLNFVTNATIRDITLKNSKFFHINMFKCMNIYIEKVTITAPGDSPNTDGIHMGDSQNITIKDTNISCGDDCISIGSGSKQVQVHGSKCGPGHGISVGSLGRYTDENDVESVTVTNCSITGTLNGLRIKAYEDSKSQLKATKFLYDGVTMDNVSFPIIIDMKYCPNNICTKCGKSTVSVEDVTFQNIVGTSATPQAVTLNCTDSLPCKGVKLINLNLKYTGTDKKTTAVCNNVVGTAISVPEELKCL